MKKGKEVPKNEDKIESREQLKKFMTERVSSLKIQKAVAYQPTERALKKYFSRETEDNMIREEHTFEAEESQEEAQLGGL